MQLAIEPFTSIWIVVVAVRAGPGEAIVPVSIVASDLERHQFEIGTPKLLSVRFSPYPTGPQALIVTFGSGDVLGLHLALGWRLPERIVDLMIEFRTLANGKSGLAVGVNIHRRDEQDRRRPLPSGDDRSVQVLVSDDSA